MLSALQLSYDAWSPGISQRMFLVLGMAKRGKRFGVQGFGKFLGLGLSQCYCFRGLVQVQSGGSLSECMGPLEGSIW